MPELLLSIYFSYKNALIAKSKGLNTVIWVLLTVLAFFASEVVAMTMVILLFYRGPFEQKAAFEYIIKNPIHIIFIYFTAIGGCLFIRYILERMRGNQAAPPVDDNNETDN